MHVAVDVKALLLETTGLLYACSCRCQSSLTMIEFSQYCRLRRSEVRMRIRECVASSDFKRNLAFVIVPECLAMAKPKNGAASKESM